MYGIPADLNLTITGMDLNQICIGKYDVQFVFDCSTIICVQSHVIVLENGNPIAEWADYHWTSIAFEKLLNCVVTGYSVHNEKLLEIYFVEGFTLQLFDNSEQYESMQIYQKNKEGIII